MTIKDLLEKLAGYDPRSEVLIPGIDGDWDEVREVNFRPWDDANAYRKLDYSKPKDKQYYPVNGVLLS